jgi:hypothetical protein
MARCSLVEVDRRFRGRFLALSSSDHHALPYWSDRFLHLQTIFNARLIHYPGDGGRTQLWNVSQLQRDYTCAISQKSIIFSYCARFGHSIFIISYCDMRFYVNKACSYAGRKNYSLNGERSEHQCSAGDENICIVTNSPPNDRTSWSSG